MACQRGDWEIVGVPLVLAAGLPPPPRRRLAYISDPEASGPLNSVPTNHALVTGAEVAGSLDSVAPAVCAGRCGVAARLPPHSTCPRALLCGAASPIPHVPHVFLSLVCHKSAQPDVMSNINSTAQLTCENKEQTSSFVVLYALHLDAIGGQYR